MKTRFQKFNLLDSRVKYPGKSIIVFSPPSQRLEKESTFINTLSERKSFSIQKPKTNSKHEPSPQKTSGRLNIQNIQRRNHTLNSDLSDSQQINAPKGQQLNKLSQPYLTQQKSQIIKKKLYTTKDENKDFSTYLSNIRLKSFQSNEMQNGIAKELKNLADHLKDDLKPKMKVERYKDVGGENEEINQMYNSQERKYQQLHHQLTKEDKSRSSSMDSYQNRSSNLINKYYDMESKEDKVLQKKQSISSVVQLWDQIYQQKNKDKLRDLKTAVKSLTNKIEQLIGLWKNVNRVRKFLTNALEQKAELTRILFPVDCEDNILKDVQYSSLLRLFQYREMVNLNDTVIQVDKYIFKHTKDVVYLNLKIDEVIKNFHISQLNNLKSTMLNEISQIKLMENRYVLKQDQSGHIIQDASKIQGVSILRESELSYFSPAMHNQNRVQTLFLPQNKDIMLRKTERQYGLLPKLQLDTRDLNSTLNQMLNQLYTKKDIQEKQP